MARRSAFISSFSRLRSWRLRVSATPRVCEILGREAPTLRSLGRAYGSIGCDVQLINQLGCGQIFNGHSERLKNGGFTLTRGDFAGERFAQLSIDFGAGRNNVAG